MGDHDQDIVIQHALRAAQVIQQQIATHPTQNTRYGNFPFAVKVGVDTGPAEWGILQPETDALPADYFFSGAAVDGAAAAEQHADQGLIVLSPLVAEIAAGWTQTEPLTDGYVRLLRADLPAVSVQAAPPDFMSQRETLNTFVLQAIQRKAETGEFRPVITVFVNFLGINTVEQLHIIMKSVFSLQEQYGGYLNRVDFGDKGCTILLFWGMPTAYENDLDRALNFVLSLESITSSTFKAGVTLRTMYAGFTGSSRRGEYSCYGAGINLAARLMVTAPWGDIWLDEQIAGRAAVRFRLEPQGDYAFKGFAGEQPVAALVGHRAEAVVFHGKFVGREAELTDINTFLSPLLDDDPASRFAGMLVVEGDAGLGKSRLLHEAVNDPTIADVCQVFVGQTDALVRQSLAPFRYWLQRYFEQSSEQSDALNKRAFSRRLDVVINVTEQDELAQELNRLRSSLGALLGLHWENSFYASLDAEARHNTSLIALRHLLQVESLRQPIILLLEDLHWADADSIRFLQTLALTLGDYPLAILATQRPGAEALPESLAPTIIGLAHLDHASITGVAEGILGGAVDERIAKLLDMRADGNPFFAEQILLFLKDSDAVAEVDGIWRLVKGRDEAPLPADIRTIFTARLDRLTHEVQNVVQTAAILGREFEVRLLSHILQRPYADLQTPVARAEAESIWAALDELRYIFHHALLRDAAYQMQLQARRRELHKLAAETLEMLHADDPDDVLDTVAYHYEAAVRLGLADLTDRAVEVLHRAGDHAAAAYDNHAAVRHYAQAIAFLPTDDDRLYGLLLAREHIHDLLGERDDQRADLEWLQQLLDAHGSDERRAEVMFRLSQLHRELGMHDESLAYTEQVIAISQVADLSHLEAEGHVMMALSP